MHPTKDTAPEDTANNLIDKVVAGVDFSNPDIYNVFKKYNYSQYFCEGSSVGQNDQSKFTHILMNPRFYELHIIDLLKTYDDKGNSDLKAPYLVKSYLMYLSGQFSPPATILISNEIPSFGTFADWFLFLDAVWQMNTVGPEPFIRVRGRMVDLGLEYKFKNLDTFRNNPKRYL